MRMLGKNRPKLNPCQQATMMHSSRLLQRGESLAQVSESINPTVNHTLIDISSSVRGLFPLESRPGLISLLAGKPNPLTFPFTSLSFTARSPTDPSQEISLSLTPEELAEGLQYSATSGLPEFCNWLTGLQEHSHGRKRGEGWRVTVGSGSQDLIYKVSL